MQLTSTCAAVSIHKIPEDRIQTHIYYLTMTITYECVWYCSWGCPQNHI